MARLIFRDSQNREGTVELSPTETVYVGRGLECAIRTDDGMVSGRDAQFRNENGRFVVEDLGSANGTHLNNTRVQKQALGHTDVIQCGSLVIRFLDEGGVNVVAPQVNFGGGGAPPPKKGGTMVLDPPAGAASGGGGGGGGFGGVVGFGAPVPASPNAVPVGGPPGMPGPPAMPQAGGPHLPYGRPPPFASGGTRPRSTPYGSG